MSLLARKHQHRAKRPADPLPKLDPVALDELGMTQAEVEAFARKLHGWVVLPGMPDYPAAAAPHAAPRWPAYPQIIVFCEVYEDVRLCIELAREKALWAVPRSGRHSLANFSTCSGMIIDVSLLNGIAVDPVAKTARVGAGANFGLLNEVLDAYGLHVPGGTCADVGVAGFMQGGGYGLTSRRFGIGSDNIVGVTVMLADGSIVEAAEDNDHRDLWWAVRGGTGNQFGIVLEFTFKLVELASVWSFELRWTLEDAPAALDAIQRHYMRNADNADVGYLVVMATLTDPVTQVAKPWLLMIGLYSGTPADGLRALRPLLDVGSPQFSNQSGTYNVLNDACLAVLPGPGLPTTMEAKRSGYVATPVGVEGWKALVTYFATTPNPYNIMYLEPYGGAATSYPQGDSAFIHREVDFDFGVDSFWDPTWPDCDEETALSWLAGFFGVVEPFLNGEMYQNYPVRDLPDYREQYWGDAFDELLRIKRHYDPDGFFRFEQSITPALPRS
ncbi:FAD-binding oxidoreductase [Solirubrobacter soli]|uniref:FAD-binding oxidoreductase n=1 Tax=Solirubrobacter soli TaxID=363832 RepID=UPI0004295D61|nr:FAD-binding oxidoreductase [Solirubrobacter soli]